MKTKLEPSVGQKDMMVPFIYEVLERKLETMASAMNVRISQELD